MNAAIEQLYQEIGQAALELAEDLSGRLLVYAEVDEGVISCDLFYVNSTGVVRFKFCPENMSDLVYSLWEQWRDHPGNNLWRGISFLVEGGKFRIEFTYHDQLKPNEVLADRRPAVIKKYFDGMTVDHSQPNIVFNPGR